METGNVLQYHSTRIPSMPTSVCGRYARCHAQCVWLWMSIALTGSMDLRAQDGEESIIRAVDIVGLERLPKSELLTRLKIRIGEVYNPNLVDDETRRLYNLGNFDRVTPEITPFEGGVRIVFNVKEKPYVRRVLFSGRSQLSKKALLKDPQLLTQENKLFNQFAVKQDVRALEEKYHREGYLFATVRQDRTAGPAGVTVTFLINEGTRVRIHEIQFVGNRALSDADLRALMSTKTKSWFFGLPNAGFYSEDDLQQDINNLKQYYRGFGYFDVRVEPEKLELNPSKDRLSISIRVEEGPVYIFRGYRFSDNAIFSDQTLRKLTTAQVNRPFRYDQLQRDKNAILKHYGDRAYVFAAINENYLYSPTKAEVHVHLTLREENEIFIEHIRVQGNKKTQERVVRRELEFYPGERVDQSKMIKSRSNLARLGIFREIEYSYEGTGSHRDVVVSVNEETSGQLIVGFGVTSGFGIIGNLSITKRNFDITDWPETIYDIPDRFTGAGQTLILVLQPGTRRSLYRLTFIEPYVFDSRNSLTLSGSSLDLIREDWDEDRSTIAPSIGHSFDFDRDFQVSLGARLENVKVKNIEPNAPSIVIQSAGSWPVIATHVTMSYNKVLFEPLEGPYDGHREVIFYEYAGGVLGGDVNFNKIDVSNDFYFPLYVHEQGNYHHVIGFSNSVGLIEPLSDDDFVPVFERYFLGGPQNVRGFRFRGLGPHENGVPFGGTARWYGNLEYTFPIFQKMLRGVLFLDYGNLSESIETFTLDEMRYTVGAGFRIMFPFLGGQPLPIGLFFGVPIKKQPQDQERLFLFTIGTPF